MKLTTILKLRKSLIAVALMLVMLPVAASNVSGEFIKLIKLNEGYEEHVMVHRAPAKYTDVVEATFDVTTDILCLEFCKPVTGVVVTICKDGVPVMSEACGDVYEGLAFSYSLSEFGTGQYEVKVTADGLDSELYCCFSVK